MPKRNGYLGIFGDLVKNLRHFRRIWPEIPWFLGAIAFKPLI